MPMLDAMAGEDSLGGEGIIERWCSDDLSALIQTNTKDSKGELISTVAMRKIERNEPDATLFQIPEGYAVSESVAGPPGRRSTNVPANKSQ